MHHQVPRPALHHCARYAETLLSRQHEVRQPLLPTDARRLVSRSKEALDVGIVSAEGAQLAQFYEQALGFEPQPELVLPGIGRIRRLAWGASVLRILQPEESPNGDAADGGLAGRPGYRYISLEVDDVAAAIAACEQSGGEVALNAVEPRPGRLVAQVRDPDGNLIELGQDR